MPDLVSGSASGPPTAALSLSSKGARLVGTALARLGRFKQRDTTDWEREAEADL
jgi:hypothetical protein